MPQSERWPPSAIRLVSPSMIATRRMSPSRAIRAPPSPSGRAEARFSLVLADERTLELTDLAALRRSDPTRIVEA